MTDRLVPSQFATIQAAIEAAVAADRIVLEAGVDDENAEVTKNLAFLGQATNTGIVLTLADGIAVTLDGTAPFRIVDSVAAESASGNEGDNVFTLGPGADTVAGAGGTDTLDLSAATAPVIVDLGASTAASDGFGSADTISGIENVIGGSAADRLTGSTVANYLGGGAGADTALGGDGHDQMDGGAGNDALFGEADSDVLLGGGGNDYLVGGGGNDKAFGEAGNDTVIGAEGDDYLNGGDGDDLIFGGSGTDTVLGAGGDDYVNGGAGDDLVFGGDGGDTLLGEDGNDYLNGENGNDIIFAHDGNDTVIGGDGDDYLSAGAGDDVLVGNDGDDALDGGAGNDALFGEADSDVLLGGSGDDTLAGGTGDDILDGGAGHDQMLGEAGKDTYVFRRGEADGDIVYDFGVPDDGLRFIGYGTAAAGASFTRLDSIHWRISSSDGTVSETITIGNGADINSGDYRFVMAPEARDDTLVASAEDAGPRTILASELLANDTDADNGSGPPNAGLTITSVGNAIGGTVALDGAGNVVFTPAANFNGTASFSYTVSDGLNLSDEAQASFTVTPTNDLPTTGDDLLTTVAEDSGPRAIAAATLLANDTGAPDSGETLSVIAVGNAVGGAVSLSGDGATITFAPAANFDGTASFDYTLSDGTFGSTDVGSASFPVTSVDDAPIALADTTTVDEDSGATAIAVLANDIDIDGGPKTIVAITQPANGTVAITGGGTGLTFTPNANFNGSDIFTYTLNGGSPATVNVTVGAVDHAPIAVVDTATVGDNSGATAIDVLANDIDIDGGPKTIVAITQPGHGTVAITGGGTGLTFTPNANFNGSDIFTYTLNGGSPATVNVTVGAVDDAPIAFVDTATVGEDSAATVIDVLANDIDIDGGPKTIAAITQPGHGTVAITGGGTGLTFTPDANFNGSDLFTYTLNSGSPATVNVTVVAADDPPDAVDDTIPDSPEDGGVRTILGAALLANDSDPDNLAGAPNAGLTVTAAGNAVGGSVAVVAGDVQFTPDPSFNGPASFEYTIDDGTGRTDTATASFDITPGWLWS